MGAFPPLTEWRLLRRLLRDILIGVVSAPAWILTCPGMLWMRWRDRHLDRDLDDLPVAWARSIRRCPRCGAKWEDCNCPGW